MSTRLGGDDYRQFTLQQQARQALIERSICLTEAAKYFGIPPKAFIQHLHQLKLIYKPAKHWLGFQDKLNTGLLVQRPVEFTHSNGETGFRSQVLITPKGMRWLHRHLLPLAV